MYQEWMAALVFAVAVTNACLLGMGGVDKAEAAIQAILNPQRGGPTTLEGALDPELSKAWAYIAILANYQLGFTLLYNLQQVNQELRPSNPIRARVVAFGGEVQTHGGTPDVLVFEKDEGALFKNLYLPRVLVTETVKAYKQDSDGDYTHTFVLDPTVEDRKAKPTTRMMPIQLEWAPMFVDNPDFGMGIQWMRDLFMSITDDERYHLVNIFWMMTRACCAAKASDGVGSTLAINWQRLIYHAKTWAWAKKKWALLQSNVGKDKDTMEQSYHDDYGELFRAEPARPLVVIPLARPNLGLQEWRPPHEASDEGAPTVASQRPASRAAGTGSGPPVDKIGPVPGNMGGITDLLV